MKKIILFIVVSLIMLGCATPEQRAERASDSAQVKFVMPDAPEWCSYRKNCKYIRDVRCRINARGNTHAKERCDQRASLATLKGGGDVFVYQIIEKEIQLESIHDNEEEESYANSDVYIAYGQAYRCSDELDSLSKKYMNKRGVHPKYRVQIARNENEERCGPDPECKFVRSYHCKTIRDKAEERCMRKIRKQMRRTLINKLVVKKEVIHPHKYSVLMDGYQCNIKPLQ